MILSHFYDVEIVINEMAVFHPTSPAALPNIGALFPTAIPVPAVGTLHIAQPNPLHSSLIKPIDIPRLQTLHDCLQAVKLSLDNFLSFTPQEYRSFPFAILCHFSHSIQLLFRLSMLDEPDWDSGAARQSADIVAILGEVSNKMGQVGSAAGLTDDGVGGDIFTKGASVLKTTMHMWDAALRQNVASRDVGMSRPAPGDNAASENACGGMEAMVDFGNDAWLMDMFTSWEG